MGSILTITKADNTTVSLPDPKRGGLTVALKDLDSESTGRNQYGTLIRDRITTKREITYSTPPLTAEEMKTVMQAVAEQTFKLTYPDPLKGADMTITVYCGDRSAPAYSCINGEWLWEGFSVSFIQC